jgi:hypothetical protein
MKERKGTVSLSWLPGFEAKALRKRSDREFEDCSWEKAVLI